MTENQQDDFSEFATLSSEPPNPENDFSQFAEPVSFGEKASAFGETVAGGAVEASGIIPGAMIGAEVGSAFFPPFGTAIGGIIGGIGGAFVGGKAREELGLRRPAEMSEELRPAAYSGEVVGGSIPFAAGPFAAAASGFRFTPAVQGMKPVSQVGTFLDDIINTAKAQPIRTAMAEAKGIGISATASGLAEAVAPGEESTRQWAEFIAPLPSEIALGGLKVATSKAQNIVRNMSPEGRMTNAAKQLEVLLESTGEDPLAIARIVREFPKQFPDVQGLTVAQMTGSKSLGALEDWVSRNNKKFGAEVEQASRDALDSIRAQIAILSKTGDPEALKEAANIQSEYFKTLITARLEAAKQIAADKVSKVSSLNPENMMDVSRAAREAIDSSITQARAAESELWNKIDKNLPSRLVNLNNTYKNLLSEMLPEERGGDIPKVVLDFMKRLKSNAADDSFGGFQEFIDLEGAVDDVADLDKVIASTGDLIRLRKIILNEARQATKADNFETARLMNRLGEAVLDDIDNTFKDADDMAYTTARTFSREFNDVFTRSFAGQATGMGKYGERIAPELLLRKATAAGGEATALKMMELEEATRFMSSRGFIDDGSYNTMLNAQEQALRIAASSSIDAKTGRVSTTKLENFLTKNSNMMERFPDVKKSIREAIDSEYALKDMEILAKGQIKTVENHKAYSKFVKKDPVTVARAALTSTNQEKDMESFLKSTKYAMNSASGDAPQKIKDGALQAVWDAAIQLSVKDVRQAGQYTSAMDVGLFKKYLFEPSVPGNSSPVEMLLDAGLVDEKHVNNMRKLISLAENIQSSAIAGTAFEVKTDIGDEVINLVARLIGSSSVGMASKATGVGGSSIIVHGAAAKFAQNVVGKIPLKSTRRVWEMVLTDPKELEMLMRKTNDPAKAAAKMKRLHAWLVRSGVYNVEEQVQKFLPEQAEE